MKKLKDYSLVLALILFWQISSSLDWVSNLLLPSPYDVILAFIKDFKLLMQHSYYTLKVAFIAVSISVVLSFVLSFLMDRYKKLNDLFYPILVLSQTIPTIAIAPLLIIWLGYYMKPKILLVVISTFFPMTISLLNGYKSIDIDNLNFFKAMGASTYQTYIHLKIPSALSHFMAGLKVSLSYSLITTVIAEWLGGYYGLGVYMTRVKKAFELDKMFAVIFLISFLSLILMYFVDVLEKKIIKK